MIIYAVLSDEEYEDLITSYEFITKMEFTNLEQVKMAIEYCQAKERLSEDTLNYLLEKIHLLHELEITESNQDWEVIGASAN